MKKIKILFYYISIFIGHTAIKIINRIYLPKGGDPNKKENKRLLIIFINTTGDFILFTSILPTLRKYYKNYEITLLGSSRWEEIVRGCPLIDKFISCNLSAFIKNPIYQIKFIRALQKIFYDIVLYPSFSRMPIGDTIVRNCSAKNKIGYDGDMNNLSEKQKLRADIYYSRLIKKPNGKKKEIEYYHHFANELGVKIQNYNLPNIWLTDKDRIRATQILLKYQIKKSDIFVVVCPGAASEEKIWHASGYAKVIEHFKKKGYKVVVTGVKNETAILNRIKEKTEVKFVDLVGKTTLRDLASIYERAMLYLGNDTGSLHIAMAVGIQTICILGGGHPFRFYPYGDLKKHHPVYNLQSCYGCNWDCKYNEAICIKRIKTKEVIEKIEYVLRSNNCIATKK